MPVLTTVWDGTQWMGGGTTTPPTGLPPSPWVYESFTIGPTPVTLAAFTLGSAAGGSTSFTAWNDECVNTGNKPGAVNLGLGLHRTYSPGGIVADFMTTAAAGDVANGVASIWSCKPDISQVASGNHDATFTSFFNSIPAGHRAWLMMWHEPWDDQFVWSTYRAAQARVWGLLNDSNADRDLVKWGILGTGYDFFVGRAQENFFPAGGEYDYVGTDPYDFYRNLDVMPVSPRGRNNHRTAAQLFSPATEFANSVGKPTVVGELGYHPDPTYLDGPMSPAGVPSKPYRFRSAIEFCVANGVEAVAMFHAPNGDDGPWWMNCIHNFATPDDRSTPDVASVTEFRNQLALYGKQA